MSGPEQFSKDFESRASIDASKARILVVEDEQKIADILADYLKQSGYEFLHRNSGIGIVEFVRESPPSLVLLDIMLPGMDGLEICREIRKFSQVPIIMVTARVDELDRLLGLELGADDYICKPFSPREVVARVKSVLRRHNFKPEEESKGPFEVDDDSMRIRLNGQKLDLTPTEHRILAKFISSPGRVYSRGQLLDLCSAAAEQSIDRTVDSHVKNIRKKVAAIMPDRDVIHSVYGVGYRFEL